MTYDDEIALLADDIRRWAGADARIHQAIEQLLKLYQAEVDALAFEAHELSGLLVRATTESEQARIAAAQPDVSWSFRETNWRGEDYLAGATE